MAKKLKRVVVYVDPDEHDAAVKKLRSEGMTLSGWFRKLLRDLIKQ